MRAHEASASDNGRGSDSWWQPWTHLRAERRSPASCHVTFDHPPINAITATTVEELAELVELIEDDGDLNVVVFGSANPDVYLGHYSDGPTGLPLWNDVLVRLARAPVVTIAAIRGLASGAGSEFILACDLRFASRESTQLGRLEAGIGVAPARLARLVGRGRALEIVPDGQLDLEIEAITSRLERLDHGEIARAKASVDR